jgi:hypothetical protein
MENMDKLLEAIAAFTTLTTQFLTTFLILFFREKMETGQIHEDTKFYKFSNAFYADILNRQTPECLAMLIRDRWNSQFPDTLQFSYEVLHTLAVGAMTDPQITLIYIKLVRIQLKKLQNSPKHFKDLFIKPYKY